MWSRLAEVAGQVPLLLVGVCRPVPRRVEVDRVREVVAGRPGAVVVELGPLGGDEVAAMVAGLLVGAAGASPAGGVGAGWG